MLKQTYIEFSPDQYYSSYSVKSVSTHLGHEALIQGRGFKITQLRWAEFFF